MGKGGISLATFPEEHIWRMSTKLAEYSADLGKQLHQGLYPDLRIVSVTRGGNTGITCAKKKRGGIPSISKTIPQSEILLVHAEGFRGREKCSEGSNSFASRKTYHRRHFHRETHTKKKKISKKKTNNNHKCESREGLLGAVNIEDAVVANIGEEGQLSNLGRIVEGGTGKILRTL